MQSTTPSPDAVASATEIVSNPERYVHQGDVFHFAFATLVTARGGTFRPGNLPRPRMNSAPQPSDLDRRIAAALPATRAAIARHMAGRGGANDNRTGGTA